MLNRDVLVEIGTEELPPTTLPRLGVALHNGLLAGLSKKGLQHGESAWFATPRRLAVTIAQVAEYAPDQHDDVLGPLVSQAKDNQGRWQPAAIGFARKHQRKPEQLTEITTAKGPKLCVRCTTPGARTADCLGAIITEALATLPIPKRMRWGSHAFEFIRPVHWAVVLYGDYHIPVSIFGVHAGNHTYGHRFHCPVPLRVEKPSDYASLLAKQGHVIADFEQRRGLIRQQVIAKASQLGGEVLMDEDLLAEVTALVEWPVALTGRFDERFLAIPSEVLILSMQSHQKYFPVVKPTSTDTIGKLMPYFITVANIDSKDSSQIIHGNERVIRPRLSDAAFFFETDKKTPLAERVTKLRSIIFETELGSMYEKTQRMVELSHILADQLGVNTAHAMRASQLSKADLTCDIVLEFDKMQGIAGYYYALHDDEPEAVALALKEHYLPRFAGDQLPQTAPGIVLALADRLDTLVGIVGVGQVPTGSKDPFALRRAALSVLRIMIEKHVDLDLRDALTSAAQQFTQQAFGETVIDEVLSYMIGRLRAWYEDQQVPVGVILAVLAKPLSNPVDIDARIRAVHTFSHQPAASLLAEVNKRVANILRKQQVATKNIQADPNGLQHEAEKALYQQLIEVNAVVRASVAQRQYDESLNALAGLQTAVDAFFTDVMVMVEDDVLRINRLALLQQLRHSCLAVADMALLVSSASS